MTYLTKVFVLEDDEFYGKLVEKALLEEDRFDVRIFQQGHDLLNNLHENPDIVTIDHLLPDMEGLEILKKVRAYNDQIIPVIVSGQDKVDIVVEFYHHGARDYIIKKDNSVVKLVNSLKNLSKNVELRKEVEKLKDQIIDRSKYEMVIGESKSILEVLKLLQKVEKTNMIVLITGESGTGKEVIAKTIHYTGPRMRRPFVAVNMAAIPEDLIESELFGHEKGAFTGASSKRIGKFEEANGGTIFLDEIGEMDMSMQTKLLRVLQDGHVTRIGGNKVIKLDVRVLAATNKNLARLVKEGKFREDLYYRLQGFLIQLPPLRERGNDILLLAKHFIKDFCTKNGLETKTLSKDAAKELLEHPWPGNVRELKAMLERAAVISENNKIDVEDLIFSPVPE